ncbi:PREDICTED: uncharacterized protein LOC109161070 isoform X1 [Ipomoea nil]|uniref:uncharacterized protein LOC109161070 isoform X1 n=1 Tax=Ipomoea nil TaxID=35883 RepID=UPI00090116E7|nr:PREDICTED: uncharacterized protein LOC109161070 isoform X1 [Ipomoea nil]
MRMQCSLYRKLFTCSPSLTPVQLPSPKETHLWYVKPNEVKSEALLKQYMEILSASEKENVLRLHGDEHRKTALLARALVRTTVARYQINSHVDPRTLKFRKNIHGKPEVEWQHSDHWQPPPLHFNISHTTSLIACGVTVDSPIGIDVEENQRTVKNNILNLARRYFSEHEYKVLCSIGDSQVQHQEFIKLWTLKEAYVKALGIGFSGAPFNTFTIRFRNSVGGSSHPSLNSDSKASEIAVDYLDNPHSSTSNWQFALIELDGSHYVAICTRKDSATGGETSDSMKLTVWKTIPFLEDVCVSGTDAVVEVNGMT